MKKSEIYTQLAQLWSQFETAHNGTKKKNAAEARKALGEIKKLVTRYRAASVAEADEA
jgi:hypothetical protein